MYQMRQQNDKRQTAGYQIRDWNERAKSGKTIDSLIEWVYSEVNKWVVSFHLFYFNRASALYKFEISYFITRCFLHWQTFISRRYYISINSIFFQKCDDENKQKHPWSLIHSLFDCETGQFDKKLQNIEYLRIN